ncbi:MAG TPA: hypothetical protein VF331_21475 [Polyangiales bacterium]
MDAGPAQAGTSGSNNGGKSDAGGSSGSGGSAGASDSGATDGGGKAGAGGGVGGSSGAAGHAGAGGTSASADGGGAADAAVLHGTGSCCAVQTTPGCGNADLEVCVCEKDPTCCSKSWAQQCVFLVQQKYCQAGVRDCVCGTGSGQWGQTACCSTDWTPSCDSVAQIKCGAVAGCF